MNEQALGLLCENNPCGALTESEADTVLQRFVDYRRHLEAERHTKRGYYLNVFVAFIALVGAVLSVAAYRQTRNNHRELVELQAEVNSWR